jgi:CubicO group peptidase (beta-lactamase class C family)
MLHFEKSGVNKFIKILNMRQIQSYFPLLNIYLLTLCLLFSVNAKSQNLQIIPPNKVSEVGFSAERLARIDSFLSNAIKTGLLPHATAYVARHGKIVYYKPYGWRNMESKKPLLEDDIFRIASQTKAIVSVGLMMLYEQGKFLLDDPVSMYISAFKDVQVLDSIILKDTTYISHKAKTEITIRHLLTHTSGLTYGNPYYIKNNIPLANSIKDETIENVVNKLAKLPLKHEPGTAYTYGLNTDVIGYLIEVISGMKLDAYLQKNIFGPLGMKDTYFYLPENKTDRLVTLYEKVHRDSALRLTRSTQNQVYPVSGAKKYLSGGAGLVGSIEDYAKFCQMLLNGGSFNGHQILGCKTIELMTTNQIGNLTINKEGDKFGLGFQLFTERGGNARFLSSKGAYRWGGMYCTDYVIDPTEDIVCLFYTNVQPFAQHGEVLEKFRVLVYQALVK